MPKISVVIPIYNVEKYINRCIDSVCNQTFTDIEIILVDDGSPDKCGVICDEYERADSRIRVIHKENGGLSSARNAGIDWVMRNSQCQWISFIDSDDWIHPRMLEVLYHAVISCSVKIGVCGYNKTDTLEIFPEIAIDEINIEVKDGLKYFFSDGVTGVVAWNKLYHKSLFTSLRYPPGKIHEDEFLTYKLLHMAGRISVTDVPLYYYFMNDSGIMGSSFSAKKLVKIEALRGQIKYTKKYGNEECTQIAIVKLFLSYSEAFINMKTTSGFKILSIKTLIGLIIDFLKYGRKLNWTNEKYLFWRYELAFPRVMKLFALPKKIRSVFNNHSFVEVIREILNKSKLE